MGSHKAWARVAVGLLAGMTVAFAAMARDARPTSPADQMSPDGGTAPAPGITASTSPAAAVRALQTLGTMWFEPDDSRQLALAFETSWDGTGVTVGVLDGGVYAAHPDLAGQFLAGSDLLVGDLRGTMVCSILAGRGTRDLGCTYNATGVAPGAKLLLKRSPANYPAAFAAWKSAGIQISNHSYSLVGYPHMYLEETGDFDKYAEFDDAVIIVACGDGGTSIPNPALAKNVIAVGALTYATSQTETIGAVAAYSNRGPTSDDARLKPELVAPGGGHGGNVCGVVGANSVPDGVAAGDEWPSDDMYTRLSGTGMAAPHVTGVCAKIKQWMPAIHSEQLKALLINTTIPIKENSDDALGGYASTTAGYGMLNGYSVTDDYPGDSQRVLFTEGTVTEDAPTQEWPINVPAGTQYLAVTLAYNDRPGAYLTSRPLWDDLDLVLIAPGGTQQRADAHLAEGVYNESPLEKMVIENPPAGTWTARVEFSPDSPCFADPAVFGQQRYGLVAHAILKKPALSVVADPAEYQVAPLQPFNLSATVTNVGGYIAAGVRVQVIRPANAAPDDFASDLHLTRFVGALPHQDATASVTFPLTAPAAEGTYVLTIAADGNNREFRSGYPKTQEVVVRVGTPGSVPTNVIASDGTFSDRVRITWTPVSGMRYYRIYRATSAAGQKVALTGWLEMTSYDDTTATPGVTYTYWVQAAANSSGYPASGMSEPDTGWCGQMYVISGHVRRASGYGLDGVVLVGLPGNPETDEDGYYSGGVPPGWSGTVTPQRPGYTFTPPSRTYTNVTGNLANQDYTSTMLEYTISGMVTDAAGQPVAGVTMEGLSGPPVTGPDGTYSASVPHGWNGTVTPVQAGYAFTPPRRIYSDVQYDYVGEDYVRWQGLDLRVASVTCFVPLPGPAAGQPVPVMVTIVNQGSETALTPRVDIWQDRSTPPTSPAGSDAYQLLANLPAYTQNTTTATFSVVYSQPGTYSLWAMVSPSAGQADMDLSNNIFQVFVEIKPAAADLLIERINTMPRRPPGGREFSVAVTIRNQGAAGAGPFRVDLWKSTVLEPVGTADSDAFQQVSGLAAGEATTIYYNVAYPGPGSNLLWARVDSLESVTEMDEDNNTWRVPVRVNRMGADADGDGLVDVVDLLSLIAAFGSAVDAPTWDVGCDFNDDGFVDVVDLLILVEDFGDNRLAGTWEGMAQYIIGGPDGMAQLETLTFDVSGRPGMLDLCLGEGHEVQWLATENLCFVGDAAAFEFAQTDAATGATTTAQVLAQVTQVAYGTRRYSIELDVQVHWTGAAWAYVSGVCSRTAEIQPDGSMLWTGQTTLQWPEVLIARRPPPVSILLARK